MPANETPQPTAALSDAELIEEAMLCASRYAQATTRIDAEGRQHYRERGDQCSAELLRRLARAESAPGVTVSVEDLRRWIITALAESGVSSAMCWTVEPIISSITAAALADAGTAREEVAG